MASKVSFIAYPCAYRAPRALRLLNYFWQRGYYLHICTSRAQGSNEKELTEVEFGNKHFPIIATLVSPWEGGIVKQAWRRAIFILKSAKAIRGFHPEFIVASDIEGLLASYLCKERDIKIIYDIRDTTGGKYYRLPKAIVRLIVWMESRIVNSADAIMIVDSRRLEELPPQVLCHPRIITVTNYVQDLSEVVPIFKRVAPKEKLQVCLCGLLIPQRGLDIALDAVRRSNNIHLVLCGTTRGVEVEQKIRKNPNTTYLGNLTHLEALAYIRQSDIVLALYDPSLPAHRICAPNKMYESLMLGRPVIVNRGTGLESIIETDGTGYVIDYSCEDLIRVLNMAYTEGRNQLAQYGLRARKAYECKYNWNVNNAMLDNLLNILSIT